MSTQTEHPRRKDEAERIASRVVGPESSLTPVTEATTKIALTRASLEDRLGAIERLPFGLGDPRAIEAEQAAAIRDFLENFDTAQIDKATAELLAAKLAETEAAVDDMKAAYAEVQAEWAAKIAEVKRRHEVREGLFLAPLRAFGERELKLPAVDARLALDEKARKRIKMQLVCGPRKLAYRDTEEAFTIADREALVARVKAEDPLNGDGRLKVVCDIASLDDEKVRAKAAMKATGEVPAGLAYKPATRGFSLQHPRAT